MRSLISYCQRIAEAIVGVFGRDALLITATETLPNSGAAIARELLEACAEIGGIVPIIPLDAPARCLLRIWDAARMVKVCNLRADHGGDCLSHVLVVQLNRRSCFRLVERCAIIVISVRENINEAGHGVGRELQKPIEQLLE